VVFVAAIFVCIVPQFLRYDWAVKVERLAIVSLFHADNTSVRTKFMAEAGLFRCV
jgi:hypothetical protein